MAHEYNHYIPMVQHVGGDKQRSSDEALERFLRDQNLSPRTRSRQERIGEFEGNAIICIGLTALVCLFIGLAIMVASLASVAN